jgi:hypothetical protein
MEPTESASSSKPAPSSALLKKKRIYFAQSKKYNFDVFGLIVTRGLQDNPGQQWDSALVLDALRHFIVKHEIDTVFL